MANRTWRKQTALWLAITSICLTFVAGCTPAANTPVAPTASLVPTVTAFPLALPTATPAAEPGNRLILVGFDPTMNEIMREMAETEITYKPLMNELGTELRQGIFWVEDVGSGEFLYISATVMGLVDLGKAYPGQITIEDHAVVFQVEREDGVKVLFPVEMWRGSEQGTLKTSTVYLQGSVIEGYIGTDREIVRTHFNQRYDYFVQKFPAMIGQQIIVAIPRTYEPSTEQYKALQEILDAISGVSNSDVSTGAVQVAERFPENPTFIIPDDGTRP